MSKIDITKPAQCRNGDQVKLYEIHDNIIFGRRRNVNGWWPMMWTADERNWHDQAGSDFDLIQNTTIEYTAWANFYSNEIVTWLSAIGAKDSANNSSDVILAAIPLRVRIENGKATITQIEDVP